LKGKVHKTLALNLNYMEGNQCSKKREYRSFTYCGQLQ